MRGVLLAILLASIAVGEETNFDSVVQAELEVLEKEINDVRQKLEFTKTTKAKYDSDLKASKYDDETKTMWFAGRRERAEEIKTLEDELIALKQRRWSGDFGKNPDLEFKDFAPGAVGRPVIIVKELPIGDTGRTLGGVLQAGSADAALFIARQTAPLVTNPLRARVIQVWDNNEVLVELYYPIVGGQKGLANAVITDVSPNDQRDENTFALPFVRVVGTREYQSNTGKRTIFELSVDPQLAEQYAEALEAFKLPEKEPRTWSDSTGQFSVEAKLVDYKMNKVYLEKSDGTTIELFLSKLSDSDREFVERALGSK